MTLFITVNQKSDSEEVTGYYETLEVAKENSIGGERIFEISSILQAKDIVDFKPISLSDALKEKYY